MITLIKVGSRYINISQIINIVPMEDGGVIINMVGVNTNMIVDRRYANDFMAKIKEYIK